MKFPRLIILCGIPGSGKTSYTNNNFGSAIILSSDSIRAELYGDESVQGDPAEVFGLMQRKAVEALNNGENVVYDATNITRKDRASIINIVPKFTYIQCDIVWAPIEMCIKRDSVRDRCVGKEIIDRMLKRFQSPFYDEGIDEINIIHPINFDITEYVYKMLCRMEVPHDNPHHELNIYDHCFEAHNIACDLTNDNELVRAATYHDCGKPYTKTFTNTKGEITEIAHYYQHQCVGAWMSYGCGITTYASWLISTHMDPFLNTKYYNNLPKFLKDPIDILHKADLAAH